MQSTGFTLKAVLKTPAQAIDIQDKSQVRELKKKSHIIEKHLGGKSLHLAE